MTRKTKKTTKPAFLFRSAFLIVLVGFVVSDEYLFMLETVEIFDIKSLFAYNSSLLLEVSFIFLNIFAIIWGVV